MGWIDRSMMVQSQLVPPKTNVSSYGTKWLKSMITALHQLWNPNAQAQEHGKNINGPIGANHELTYQ